MKLKLGHKLLRKDSSWMNALGVEKYKLKSFEAKLSRQVWSSSALPKTPLTPSLFSLHLLLAAQTYAVIASPQPLPP